MTTLQKETEPKVTDSKHNTVDSQTLTELSEESFKTFCDDIAGMFGVNIECNQLRPVEVETSESLKKYFKEPLSIHCVKAEGALEGTFHLMLDRDGLLTLAGVVSMHSEQVIQESIKSGSLENAGDMSSVLTEVGEALVGAWDRVFRKGLDGHNNFAQTNVFIGNPWSEPEKISLSGKKELMLAVFQITINPYPTFKCGVIFPKELFMGALKPKLKQAASTEEANGKKTGVEEVDSGQSALVRQDGSEEVKTPVPDQTNQVEDIASITTLTDKSESEPISETIRKMVQDSSATTPNSTDTISTICAKDIMQKAVLWGSPEDSVQQAITTMQQHSASYIMIGQNGVLEGIISKSDLKGAISPYLRPEFAKWRRPLDDATLQIKVKWIMSKPVHTIREETPLAAIMENICRSGVRCLPVVNNEDKVQGLVTAFDIFKVLLKSSPNASPPQLSAKAEAGVTL
jgi:CBS domain-containing protein/chemotaxis protein CheY-P-specific phosphatase CheC